MLRIIKRLKPFFEDCYREIGVREYSREMGVSPPTASKILKDFSSENLLNERIERGYLLFKINRDSFILQRLSEIYWTEKLGRLVEYINLELYNPTIVLFGSLSKLEVTDSSDIDLAIFSTLNKEIDLQKYERLLKRKVQIFHFNSLEEVNKELINNILNGNILSGRIEYDGLD